MGSQLENCVSRAHINSSHALSSLIIRRQSQTHKSQSSLCSTSVIVSWTLLRTHAAVANDHREMHATAAVRCRAVGGRPVYEDDTT